MKKKLATLRYCFFCYRMKIRDEWFWRMDRLRLMRNLWKADRYIIYTWEDNKARKGLNCTLKDVRNMNNDLANEHLASCQLDPLKKSMNIA